ncbi:MAG: hypothetical protein DRO99_00235 [Candidatus Aenigmatarchaeota archaeon]|nr:MAG: hypothetical protein DRO99_00235 [Candidatus Aenigmarchaeota archaeon]
MMKKKRGEKHMNLKIKFVPYEKFKENNLGKFMKELKHNTIVLIDAKLSADEEAKLIKETMEKVSNDFSGIEMNSLELSTGKQESGIDVVKNMIIERITGKKRGLTIIGPAKTVRQIRKNPEELLLYM